MTYAIMLLYAMNMFFTCFLYCMEQAEGQKSSLEGPIQVQQQKRKRTEEMQKEKGAVPLVQTLLDGAESLGVQNSAAMLHRAQYLFLSNFYKVTHCNCVCGGKFNTIESLNDHIREQHKKGKEYKCPQCEQAFVRLISFISHIDKDHFQKSYICKVPGCNNAYRTYAGIIQHALRCHMRSQEKKEKKGFPCNCTCGEKFGAQLSLRDHIREKHKVGEMYKCSRCNNAYKLVAIMQHVLLGCPMKPQEKKRKRGYLLLLKY